MKFSAVLLCAASVALATPAPGSGPAVPCTISFPTQYAYASLRPTPCNNQPPVAYLYQGDTVYNLGAAEQYGCGFYYTQVMFPQPNGANVVGWVNSDYVECDGPYY